MTLSPEPQLLLRGEDAARAQPIDLVEPMPIAPVVPIAVHGAKSSQPRVIERRSGFEQGLEEGRRAAAREVETQRRLVAASLGELVDQLTRRSEEMASLIASETVELAMVIAEEILGRELAVSADPGGEAIARCLHLAPDLGDLVARLHPECVEVSEVIGLGGRGLTIVADANLRPGDVLVSFEDGAIDGCIDGALARVRAVLK